MNGQLREVRERTLEATELLVAERPVLDALFGDAAHLPCETTVDLGAVHLQRDHEHRAPRRRVSPARSCDHRLPCEGCFSCASLAAEEVELPVEETAERTRSRRVVGRGVAVERLHAPTRAAVLPSATGVDRREDAIVSGDRVRVHRRVVHAAEPVGHLRNRGLRARHEVHRFALSVEVRARLLDDALDRAKVCALRDALCVLLDVVERGRP